MEIIQWLIEDEDFLIALGRALSSSPHAVERWTTFLKLAEWIPYTSDQTAMIFEDAAYEASSKKITPDVRDFESRQSFRNWLAKGASDRPRASSSSLPSELHEARRAFLQALLKMIILREDPHVILMLDYARLKTELKYFIEAEGNLPIAQEQVSRLYVAMDRHIQNRCLSYPYRMSLFRCYTMIEAVHPVVIWRGDNLTGFAKHWKMLLVRALPEDIGQDLLALQAFGVDD